MRRSVGIAATAGVVLALTGAAALSAPQLLAPVPVSTAGQETSSALGVAMNAAGDVTAVWGRPGTATTISSAEHRVGGDWSAQTDASSGGVGVTLGSGTSVDGSGTAYAFWAQQLTSGPDTFVVRASSRPAGGGWGTPHDLDAVVAFGGPVAGAVNEAGDAVAIWMQYTGGSPSFQTKVATKPAGGAWSAPTSVGSPGNAIGSPDAAINAHGDAAVTWNRAPGGTYGVEAAVRPAGGGWTAKLVTSGGGDATAPQVGIDDAGNATVVFQRATAPSQSVQFSTLAAGGASWSGGVGLSNAATAANAPQLTVTKDGAAIAAWERGGVIEVALRANAGAAFGSATPLSGTGASSPALAVNAAGDALLAWTRFDAVLVKNVAEASVRAPGGAFGSVLPVGVDLSSPRVAIDAAGDGAVLAWDATATPHRVRVAPYDASPPVISGVTFPALGVVGTPLDYAASVRDVLTPAPTATWGFGDGESGPASGRHTYARQGTFTATLTATDAAGNHASVQRTLAIAAPASGGAGGGAGGKPALSGLKLTPASFRAAVRGASIAKRRARPGTRVGYRLSRAATVRFAVLQRGVRSGRRCVTARRRPAKAAKRCTRRLGGFSRRAAQAGGVRFRFTGRVGGKALAPGAYTLRAVPRNASGKGAARDAAFRVLGG